MFFSGNGIIKVITYVAERLQRKQKIEAKLANAGVFLAVAHIKFAGTRTDNWLNNCVVQICTLCIVNVEKNFSKRYIIWSR